MPPVPGAERDGDLSGSSWPDVVLRDGASGRATLLETGGQLDFRPAATLAGNWSGKDLVVPVGDLDRDGRQELLARSADSGRSQLYAVTATGLARGRSLADLFARVDQLTAVGDWTGDGRTDLVGRVARTGRLVLYPGTATGGFGPRTLLARDWSRYDLTTGVGDLTGDGVADLVARDGDTLYLVPGAGGTLGVPVALPGGWQGFGTIAGAGDLTGDRVPDLVVTDPLTGRGSLYRGVRGGGLRPRPFGPFPGLDGVTSLAGTASLDDDKSRDLVVRTADGRLVSLLNNGSRNVSRMRSTGVDLSGTDAVVNVGDWNQDGRNDLVTRQVSTGAVGLRLGLGAGSFAPPQTMRADSRSLRGLVPVGDMSGDGFPDLLVAHTPTGQLRLLRGNGQLGLAGARTIGTETAGSTYLGVGRWDADRFPDVVERTSADQLLLRRSSGFDGALQAGVPIGSAVGFGWLRSSGDVNGDGHPDLLARRRATGDLWVLPGTGAGLGTPMLLTDGLPGSLPVG